MKSTGTQLVYEPSGKHCEPITAQKPGVKCPSWSASIAQELLNESEPWGDKRVATRNGVAFVAQSDYAGATWHGYPEAWDLIEPSIVRRWKQAGKVKSKHLRHYRSRRQLRSAFGGSLS